MQKLRRAQGHVSHILVLCIAAGYESDASTQASPPPSPADQPAVNGPDAESIPSARTTSGRAAGASGVTAAGASELPAAGVSGDAAAASKPQRLPYRLRAVRAMSLCRLKRVIEQVYVHQRNA